MATVSGFLRFDRDRTAASAASMPGIANVPVVLQNTDTNQFLAVNTNADGSYTFINVPDGNYRIVEAYGTAPAVSSPGDFSNAAAGSPVQAAFPPINYAADPPAGSTNLDSTTPNTLNVTVAGSDLSNQDILNGPVKYSPIQTILDTGVVIQPDNLITEANKGDFGSFPQGTPANTGADPNPYPNIGSGFTYVQPNPVGVNPGGGQYTIQNTMNDATAAVQNTWWRVSDHTTGNETGRMMVINGDNPGKTIFEQKVSVKPDTYYLMSSWILNLSKSSDLIDPQLGVQVLDANGQTIYNSTLGTLIPMDPNSPEWKQIGTVINSQGNDSLTIRFRSMGPEVVGNDYAIDDIALNEVQITAYSPKKSADKTVTRVGDIVTYTVTLTNTGANPLINPSIKDAVPAGMSFIPGTVTVNGESKADADPNAGITAPDINGGETLTVTFQAKADSIPTPNPTVNTADAAYSYTPVSGGIPIEYKKRSNDANVEILPASADLVMQKTADKNPAPEGSTLTYTLTATNDGPSAAQGITINDQTPSGLAQPEYSTDNGMTWQPWGGTFMQAELVSGSSVSILIRGTVGSSTGGDLVNSANVTAVTPDPDVSNNTSSVTTPVTALADLDISKSADKQLVPAGEMLTYTLKATNNGPNPAKGVTIEDQTELDSPEYSADGGATWQPWNGTFTQDTLDANASVSILIRGMTSSFANGFIMNTGRISSTTTDPDTSNNSSRIRTAVKTSADLAITKTADKNPVKAGEMLIYTLTVTNIGPNPARNVVISDQIPAGLTQPEYSFAGMGWQPWDGFLMQESLRPNDSFIIRIRGKVSDSASGEIVNTGSVRSSTPDPNEDNNTNTVTIPISTSADLSLSKTADKNPAKAGEQLTYTLTAANGGPNPAKDVVITDQAPAELLSPEYSADGGATWQPWTGSFTQDSLAANSSVTLLIRGKVSNSASGEIVNKGSVSSSTTDPNEGNNTNTVTTPLSTSADLNLSKTADKNPVKAGETLTYTLTAANNGPNPAKDVVITDQTASELTSPEYSSDNGVTWQPWGGTFTQDTLAANASVTLLIRGKVSNSAIGETVNTGSVRSSTPDPNEDNNTNTVTIPISTSADLSLSKTADKNPVKAGETLTYTLTAANNGPNPAKGVMITDQTASELTSPEYSSDNGVTWQPWGGTFTQDTLAANASVTLLIRGKVSNSASGEITNTAVVSSKTPDPNSGNNSSGISTPVTPPPTVIPPSADIRLSKTADKNPAKAGEQLTYTLTAFNSGPDSAQDVVISDRVPAELLSPEFSSDGGATWQPWSGSFSQTALAAGTSVTLLIRGTLSDSAAAEIMNSAAVTGKTHDPNTSDNTITVTTPVIKLPPVILPPPQTPSADVSVLKTVCPCVAHPGDTVTFKIVVKNSGPTAAENIVLNDPISKLVLDPIYTPDGGETWYEWNGSADLGGLAAGEQITILIKGVLARYSEGYLTNFASISSSTEDPDLSNNSSKATLAIGRRGSCGCCIR